MTESELKRREQALAERLTPEFLETLREAVRVVGWSVDAVESMAFVAYLHEIAGQPAERGSMEPYQADPDAETGIGEPT
jgi:hypothetical protein